MNPSRRGLGIAALAALALTLPAGSAAKSRYPLLYVGGNNHLTGGKNKLTLDAFDLDRAASAQGLTITIPPAYGVSIAHKAGFKLAFAEVGTVKSVGGKITWYIGQLVVMSASAYAADSGAQACSPGKHTATWVLDVFPKTGSQLTIPVAVDRSAQGYKLAMCFNAVRAKHLRLAEVYLEFYSIFRNPSRAGEYTFVGIVTPFAADGSANTRAAYELRAYEDLPQTLTAKLTWSRATKVLTISGVLRAAGQARNGINVHVFAGKTSDKHSMTEIGVAVTRADGSYTFTKKLATPPGYAYGHVNHYTNDTCAGTSAAPGGCVSHSTDGVSSKTLKVSG